MSHPTSITHAALFLSLLTACGSGDLRGEWLLEISHGDGVDIEMTLEHTQTGGGAKLFDGTALCPASGQEFDATGGICDRDDCGYSEEREINVESGDVSGRLDNETDGPFTRIEYSGAPVDRDTYEGIANVEESGVVDGVHAPFVLTRITGGG